LDQSPCGDVLSRCVPGESLIQNGASFGHRIALKILKNE
jgi:hypothetical protein